MDLFSRLAVLFLLLMLVNAIFVSALLSHRLYRTARQSRAFIQGYEILCEKWDLEGITSIARRYRNGHVPDVLNSGFSTYLLSPSGSTHSEAVDIAIRAFEREQKLSKTHLRVGLRTLATIAGTAPFIGLLGTCSGIMNAFGGIGMEKWTAMAMVTTTVSEALVPTIAGLLVAIPAVWFHNYFQGRIEVMDAEMSNAALEGVTLLNVIRTRPTEVSNFAKGTFSADEQIVTVRLTEAPHDPHLLLLPGMWACGAYVVYLLGYATCRFHCW